MCKIHITSTQNHVYYMNNLYNAQKVYVDQNLSLLQNHVLRTLMLYEKKFWRGYWYCGGETTDIGVWGITRKDCRKSGTAE